MGKPVAVLDVDGTLVDNNYQHAIAWHQAIRRAGIVVPVWKCHRTVGVGGDKFVAQVCGDEVEAEHGDAIREHESEIFGPMRDDAAPLAGAREFVATLKERGNAVVLASSGNADDIGRYVELLEIGESIDAMVTSDDVEASKPEPDLLEAALERIGRRDAVMVGDTFWDVAAAERAGIPCIALLSGGFGGEELRSSGAVEVYESVAELTAKLADSALA
jgi:HAD superfamily hydrolase (TIGR01549 family)